MYVEEGVPFDGGMNGIDEFSQHIEVIHDYTGRNVLANRGNQMNSVNSVSSMNRMNEMNPINRMSRTSEMNDYERDGRMMQRKSIQREPLKYEDRFVVDDDNGYDFHQPEYRQMDVRQNKQYDDYNEYQVDTYQDGYQGMNSRNSVSLSRDQYRQNENGFMRRKTDVYDPLTFFPIGLEKYN